MGRDMLARRSYRIPWMLQFYCHLLVERMDERRADVITLDDVRAVLDSHHDYLWRFLRSVDLSAIGGGDRSQSRQRGLWLLLLLLARSRYFVGDTSPPIADPELEARNPSQFGFTVDEAKTLAERQLAELLLSPGEKHQVARWLAGLDLERALLGLSLTLILALDPQDHRRFIFPMHTFPLELQRQFGTADPTIDELVVSAAVEFQSALEVEQASD